VLLATPYLESLGAPRARGDETAIAPRRFLFVYAPNGAVMDQWTPQGEGVDFTLSPTLEPLAPFRESLLVVSGLAHKYGEANGDGPGDHARASASYLTAAQPRKTASVDIRSGVSIDQALAAQIGEATRLPSLELGCDKGQQAGACDSGYACAYQFNLAWKTPTLPLPPEVDPRQVFERLFATGSQGDEASRQERQALRKSVLDYVQEETRRLRDRLGQTDGRKLEEYLESVRDVERRIEKSAQVGASLPPGADRLDLVPGDYGEHLRIMFDLAALAFQSDATRVITMMIAHDGSNRSYPFLEVPDGHHDLSHHGGNLEKQAKIAKINRFHVEQFAHLLKRLSETPESEGSLLDSSLVAYGSGLSDGDAHDHHDLPLLLAGRAGGAVATGRHLRVASRTPMANLFLSMLDITGASAERFGDSTGPLEGLGPA
jgi:hypothetical protein